MQLTLTRKRLHYWRGRRPACVSVQRLKVISAMGLLHTRNWQQGTFLSASAQIAILVLTRWRSYAGLNIPHACVINVVVSLFPTSWPHLVLSCSPMVHKREPPLWACKQEVSRLEWLRILWLSIFVLRRWQIGPQMTCSICCSLVHPARFSRRHGFRAARSGLQWRELSPESNNKIKQY